MVLRRVVILGDSSEMLSLGSRELWAPLTSYFLPHRKREAASSLLAELTDHIQARLVVGVISGSNRENRLAAAQKTWLKSMDVGTDAVVVFSDQNDPDIPTVGFANTGELTVKRTEFATRDAPLKQFHLWVT